jgi:hypothetical protein
MFFWTSDIDFDPRDFLLHKKLDDHKRYQPTKYERF